MAIQDSKLLTIDIEVSSKVLKILQNPI